jgi:hypothetical protein
MALNQSKEEARLRAAVQKANVIFYRHKRFLKNLSPRFWEALLELAGLGVNGPIEVLLDRLDAYHATLGAPGDFGRESPCGQALRELYAAHNAAVTARRMTPAETPET